MSDDTPPKTGGAGQKKPGPDKAGDREDLKAGIEQTREELGDTVDALQAKADVPSRVRDRAAQLREQATGTLGTLTQTVRDKAPQVREQAAGTLGTLTQTVRDKAPQVREQVAGPVAKVGQAVPEPVARTGRRATRFAGERPAALYAAAGVCAAIGMWLWRRGRKAARTRG
jgi:Protein of unknown function (DUF3618)